MRCVASGTTGYVHYRWSRRYSNTNPLNVIVTLLDAKVHTCSVTNGRLSGSNEATVNAIGEFLVC